MEQSRRWITPIPSTGVKVYADKGVFEKACGSWFWKSPPAQIMTRSLFPQRCGQKFKLYDVKFLDADGNEVAPNGTVSISLPITAGYDSANVAAYRLSDGSKDSGERCGGG